ncbi:MAG: T9SS type A sorting domain-containing protein [Candidatus Peribacteria bacterium]|nr:MAG: T9SS type A sorting domain-containing protein [Candidatus Peribacteria bacterium]
MKKLNVLWAVLVALLAIIGFPAAQAQVVVQNHEHEVCVSTNHDHAVAQYYQQKIEQVRNSASTRQLDEFEFARDSMEMYMLLAYDNALLSNHTQAEIEQQIKEVVVDGIVQANNCAGIPFDRFHLIYLPVQVNAEYASVYDAQALIENPSGPLHWVLEEKQEMDYHYLLFFTKTTSTGKGVAGMVTPAYPYVSTAFAVINYQQVELGSITGVHEFGHLNGLDHENPYAGPQSDTKSRAFVGTTAWSSVKSAGNLTKSVRCWSGPNSSATDYLGNSVLLWDGICDNATAMVIGRNLFLDGIDRTTVQVYKDDCGSGQLIAVSNNADEWEVSIVSGDANISSTEQPNITYTAYTATTLRIIGHKSGKAYADTVFVDIPAIETVDLGEFDVCKNADLVLMNGDTANYGLNEFYMPDSNGCEKRYVATVNPLPVDTFTESIIVCEDELDDIVLENGQFAQEGHNSFYLTNQYGCQDLYEIEVEVMENTYEYRDTTLYFGAILYNQSIDSTGIYIVELPGQGTNGCKLIIIFNVMITSSTEENSHENDVVLFPNPTTGNVTVKTQGDVSIFVSSISGQILLESSSKTFDISDFQTGLYFVRVVAADGSTFSDKIIKR